MSGAESDGLDDAHETAIAEIDTHLCSLDRIVDIIRETVERTRHADGCLVMDFTRIEARGRNIAHLRHLHARLKGLLSTVAAHGQAADALHAREITAMQSCLARAAAGAASAPARPASDTAHARFASGGAASDTPHAQPASGGPASDRPRPQLAGAPPPAGPDGDDRPWQDTARMAKLIASNLTTPRGEPPAARERRAIVLDDGIELDAVIVPGTLSCGEVYDYVKGGDQYFIPQSGHFAARIGPSVFNANIAKIYTSDHERPPVRVKECRRTRCAQRGDAPRCRYYHDPRHYVGSTDVRNFIADSWLYLSALSRYNTRYGSRRFGSREYLAADLREISAPDARRYVDQVSHDLLCALILQKYVLRPRQ